MRPTRLAFLIALLFAGAALGCGLTAHAQEVTASPAATPAPPALPSPRPGPDVPQRHKFAVQQFLAWQQGDVDRTLYTDELNGELNDDLMDRATKTLANMGALQSAVFLGTAHAKGIDVYVYKMTCEHGSVNMDFALDPSGKVSVIFFE